ncbi:hypothetical protein ACVWXO_000426 [Bradyrhizobium sp. LM2.7]
MPSDEPRRYLVAVGVDAYSSPEWSRLVSVPDELECIIGLLTETRFKLERILESESKSPNRQDFLSAVSRWVRSGDRLPDDHLVLYWSGHGEVLSGQLRLIMPATVDVLVDSLALEDLVEILLQEDARIGPVLLLLDVCYASHAALDIGKRLGDLMRARPRPSPPSIVALSATGSREYAYQQVFANAFVDAVRSALDPEEWLSPCLDILQVAERVTAQMQPSGQKPGLWLSGAAANFAFIRNPYHISHLPRNIDLATRRLFGQLDPVARGVASIEEVGWFFQGRRKVFADLCRWLSSRPKPGLCWITGDVGAGKSAVLSRLYLLSRADYRAQLEPQTLNATEMPPIGAIDGMVLLSGKTMPEVIADIARELRAVAETRDQLVDALRRRKHCPTLLVDGLDEAVAPRSTRELLEHLAQSTARIILGSRLSALEGAISADLEIDLDVAPWSDQEAVEHYLQLRLSQEHAFRMTSDAPWRIDTLATAQAIAKRASGNFLIARLTATALIAGAPDDPRNPEWRFPKRVGDGFNLIFATLGDEEATVRDLLLPLCYAQDGGLPRGQLWIDVASCLSDHGYKEDQLIWLFEKAGYFISEDLQDDRPVYRPFHAALREHLDRGNPREIHLQFATVLRACLDPEARSSSSDVGYARATLTRHLRLAGAWQEIKHLIEDPSWIAGQSGRHALDPAHYVRDVDEVYAASHAANSATASEGQYTLPGLGPTVWYALWRSGLVGQVGSVPPTAWALAVRIGAISPATALRSATSVGNDDVRAIRLAVLAPLFRGRELDELLDFAAGSLILPNASAPPSSDSVPNRYAYILCAALAGPESRRFGQPLPGCRFPYG